MLSKMCFAGSGGHKQNYFWSAVQALKFDYIE